MLDKFFNGDVYLRLNTEADYLDLLNRCRMEDVTWNSGADAVRGRVTFREGMVLCGDDESLTWMLEPEKVSGIVPIEVYSKYNKCAKYEVGRTEIVDYVDKLIDYTPIQGDRYRFELYDYEYILAYVGGQEFNLINMVTGNLLTSDSFELPKCGIDLIRYAGSAITHVNGNKIL